MIVDSSALIAILAREADAVRLATRLLAAGQSRISAANYVETAIVADARARSSGRSAAFQEILDMFALEIVDVTADRAESARQAYRRYGKGYHPARLNFGDCFAYALAKEFSEPLLFKGADFALTDVDRAL